ncbi:hypothetical protein BJ878DRAFT_540603 [Calycina marina]|uniref:NB-ARC domain-containing protein n=1 Tax=Calycina marina TaxID=1763456 RepID=A0A9P7Z675_9HELO|nr:hypothetical protein BJ878DRAFT_540603 [Calycina marina]
MTFGYDATAAFSKSVADIEDHARDLLYSLEEVRSSRNANRPLVLVAHSLGGHVIKQSLVIAARESRHRCIVDSTVAVVFFGTPHQGSDYANNVTSIANALGAITFKPTATLLEALKFGSPKLKLLTDQFVALAEQRQFNIVSFYETKAIGWKLVVTKASALLTPPGAVYTFRELQIPVPADHRGVCQFASQDDRTYKAFVGSVIQALHGDQEVQNEYFLISQSANPNFTGRADVQELLDNNLVKNTYMREQDQEIFVLYGLGGSGKTQVSLKFAHDHRNDFFGIFWIDASSVATAQQGFIKIARACKQKETIKAIKTWLADKERWLLIIDNADDPSLNLSQYIPDANTGTIIITTRCPEHRKYASRVSNSYRVDQMDPEDAVSLLLKMALLNVADENARGNAMPVVKALGYLALAIVQAGATLRQQLCSLESFCDVFVHQKRLLLEAGGMPDDYQNSIYTTWEMSVHQIEVLSLTDSSATYALELLQTFSCLHFDGIREETFERARINKFDYDDEHMFVATATCSMMPSGWSPLVFAKALKVLLDFSLITVDESRRISMHPLVHEWSRERMTLDKRTFAWESAVSTLAMSLPWKYTGWDPHYHGALFPHIEACLSAAEGNKLMFADASKARERFIMVDKFAKLFEAVWQYKRALDLHDSNLRLKQLTQLPNDPSVLYTMRRQAECLCGLYRFEEAARCQEQVLMLADQPNCRILSEDLHTLLLFNIKRELADIYTTLGQFEKALAALEEVMHACNQELGAKDPCTRKISQSLACCKYSMCRFAETVKLQEEIVKDDPSANNKHALAMTYFALGQKAKAFTIQREILQGVTVVLGEFHPRTLQCKTFYLAAGRYRDTGKLKARENHLEVVIANLGEVHLVTRQHMANLTDVYMDYCLFEKAIKIQERAVEIGVKTLGHEHPSTRDSALKLKELENKLKKALRIRGFYRVIGQFLKINTRSKLKST